MICNQGYRLGTWSWVCIFFETATKPGGCEGKERGGGRVKLWKPRVLISHSVLWMPWFLEASLLTKVILFRRLGPFYCILDLWALSSILFRTIQYFLPMKERGIHPGQWPIIRKRLNYDSDFKVSSQVPNTGPHLSINSHKVKTHSSFTFRLFGSFKAV